MDATPGHFVIVCNQDSKHFCSSQNWFLRL